MGQHMVETLQLKSPAFRHNGEIPERFTCDGENISPTLQFFSPNPEVQTFVLIVDDPDAPGGVFTHWVIWNIDAETNEIQEGAVPVNAVQGMNSAGEIGYFGPCPPEGEHRYRFHLFAMDTHLGLAEGASRKELEQAMEEHVMDQAVLTGRYHRRDQHSNKRRLMSG